MDEMNDVLEDILEEIDQDYGGDLDGFIEEIGLDRQKQLYDKLKTVYTFSLPGAHKYTNLSYTNMRQDYMIKFLTTGLIGYEFRRLLEYKVPKECEPIAVEDYIKNPSLLDPEDHELKDTFRLKKIEEHRMALEKQKIIYEFLMDTYSFNPDKHIRTAHWPNDKDPERDPVTTKAAVDGIKTGNTIRSKQGRLKSTRVAKLRRDRLTKIKKGISTDDVKVPEDDTKVSADDVKVPDNEAKQEDNNDSNDVKIEETSDSDSEEEYEDTDDEEPVYYSGYEKNSVGDIIRNVIPSADYFYHFNRYLARYYEELHKGTTDLYAEKHDVDIAFAIWDQYKEEVKADEFRHKHKDDSPFVIHTIKNNNWVLTGPWSKNQARMEYYNKNTEVMSSMMDKQIEDNKIVEDMVHNRVRIAKEENIKEVGPESDAWVKYSAANRPSVASMGAININNSTFVDDEKEKPKKRKRKRKSKPIPLVNENEAVEIGVISLSRGGKKVTVKKMYTAAQEPDIKNPPVSQLSGDPSSYQ